MGQIQGQLGKQELEEFKKHYQEQEQTADQHYGEVKIFESYQKHTEKPINQQQQKKLPLYQKCSTLVVKESVFQEPFVLERESQIMKELKRMAQKNHDSNTTNNIIDVYDYFVQSEEQLCSSVQRMQIVLEYIQRDLHVEIKTKRLQNQRFTPQEIFTIAFSCINALSHLQKFNLAYGDLKTFDILVSEYFEIKLLHPSINKIIPSFIKIISQSQEFSTKGIYVSPLLLKAIVQKNYHPVHNPFKSDVFTLGIILIECCNLAFCDDLFNYETGEFKTGLLNDYLLKIKSLYGLEVFNLLIRMTSIDENQRDDFIQLSNFYNVQQQMNQLHLQTKQMIEIQNKSLNNQREKFGVSLYKKSFPEEDEETETPFQENNNQGFLAYNEINKEQYTFQNLDKKKTTENSFCSNNFSNNNYVNNLQKSAKNPPFSATSTNNEYQMPEEVIHIINEFKDKQTVNNNYVPLQDKQQILNIPLNQQQFPYQQQIQQQQQQLYQYKIPQQQNNQIYLQQIHQESVTNQLNNNAQPFFTSNRQTLRIQSNQLNQQIQQQNPQQIPQQIPVQMIPQPLQMTQVQQQQATQFAKSNNIQQKSNYENIHEIYDDNSYYIGEKLDGLRHGIGKFYYADGGYYEGEWVKGRMEGLGTLYYPSGSLAYMGQWKNDQFNGKGTVYNEQPVQIQGDFDISNFDNLGEFWIKYEGEFIDDNKEGEGIIYLSNGEMFQGNFQNDFVHGEGTFFKGNQAIFQGVWEYNHLVQ